MRQPECQEILIDVGMPVLHESNLYNCRILFLNAKILLIRPKMFLANDGNYRETRWFQAWTRGMELVDYALPKDIVEISGQQSVPMGNGILVSDDGVRIGIESCEELFTPKRYIFKKSDRGVPI